MKNSNKTLSFSEQFFAFRIFRGTEIYVECKVATKSNQSICDLCYNLKSLSTDEISNHVKSVHIGKDLKCIHCKLVIKVEFLERHAKSCINLYSYKLTLSEKKYILEVVRLGPKLVIQCTICDKFFSTTKEFVSHLKSIHPIVVWFCCSICDSEVPFDGVVEHTSTHTLIDNYAKWLSYYCLSMPRKAIFINDLKFAYSLVRTTEGFLFIVDEVKTIETAKCNICTTSFENLHKFENHIKMKHNLGYKCILCNKVIGYTHIMRHIHFDNSGSTIDCIKCISMKILERTQKSTGFSINCERELIQEKENSNKTDLIQVKQHSNERELIENNIVRTDKVVDEEQLKGEEIVENDIIKAKDEDNVYVKNELPLELIDDIIFCDGVEVQNELLEDDSRPCSAISSRNIEEAGKKFIVH